MPEALFTPGGVLSRRQSEECEELSRAGECADILDARGNRGGRYRANSGNAHQAPGCPVRLRQPHDGAVACGDLIVEGLQLTDNRRERVYTQSGMERSPSKIAAANAWAPLGPWAAIIPTSARWPRNALRSCVR